MYMLRYLSLRKIIFILAILILFLFANANYNIENYDVSKLNRTNLAWQKSPIQIISFGKSRFC